MYKRIIKYGQSYRISKIFTNFVGEKAKPPNAWQ